MKPKRTLVLNNAYMPLSLFPLSCTTVEDAITRYLTDSCDVVEWYPEEIGTVRDLGLQWPAVIANRNGHGYRKEARLKKESLYYRDHCVCQYCGVELSMQNGLSNSMTFDHYHPESKGGKHVWDNVVASCKECNNTKGDSVSSRWKPRQTPWTPTFHEMVKIRSKYPILIDHPSWAQFLPSWSGEVIVKGSNIIPFNQKKDEILDRIDVA